MNRIKHYLILSHTYILDGLNFASLLMIFFMAIWLSLEVISRSFFDHPFSGTGPLVKSLLPAIVFLSLAYTLHHDRHIRVTIVLDHMSERAKSYVDICSYFMGFICFMVVMFSSIEPAWTGWLTREYEGIEAKIPVYPIRFIVVLGAGLFSLEFLLKMIARVKSLFLHNQIDDVSKT